MKIEDNTCQGKRVLVAMSGGVDSSVAALVLKQQGYDVTGATLQIWPDLECKEDKQQVGCCSLSAVEDARRVANQLDIPYYVLNFKEIFNKEVIEPFVMEYLSGRTPNPCITCNWKIKFEAMLNKALSLGFDYLATGHYGEILYSSSTQQYSLQADPDNKKDQTYALYRLTQFQLSHLLLPLGNLSKDKIRNIAAQNNLAVATKKDSQEICFVQDNNYRNFIEQKQPNACPPGNFVNHRGEFLGRHQGISNYTIGQRKGLGVIYSTPLYVVYIDPKTNNITLGTDEDLFAQELIAEEIHWIESPPTKWPIEVLAKIRYSALPVLAKVMPEHADTLSRLKVTFDKPVRAITPGQSVVFYGDNKVLGGGLIC